MRARHAKAMTLREWADLPEDVPGELFDGVLVEEEVPNFNHERLVAFLVQLFAWADDRGGMAIGSEAKYGVTPKRGRKPDVTVYLPGTPRPRGRDNLGTTPPDIAVEIITATPRDARRDRVEKLAEYAKFGIRWYWLVDPALRGVQIFELDAKRRYVVVASVTAGVLPVPGCRGLKLDVDKMWLRLDDVS